MSDGRDGSEPGSDVQQLERCLEQSEMREQKLTQDLAASDRTGRQGDAVLSLFLASVTDYAIFLLDPAGHVATWNAGAERFKGYHAEEIIGRHFSVFYPEADVRAGKCEMELEVAGRVGRFEDEGWRIRKDGTRFWANVVITAVRDSAGALVGFGKVTKDLTERLRANDERAARLAAEQASAAKDDFLAMLGHELRNPLAPITTALQLMKLRGGAPAPREMAIVERQVVHLGRLVDDLLDSSRIARGKIEIRPTRLDVRSSVARAVEIASPLIEQRDQRLDISAPSQPVMVLGDDTRLAQVFSNLLTNASKFTQRGGRIAVTVRAGETIEVEVRDEGSGIPATLLPRIFDLFVQGPQGSDRRAGGLGLGLALVRALTQLHGGTVSVESEPGRGSRFIVRLPTVDANDASEPAPVAVLPDAAAAAHKRVLVVDDNEDALELLEEILGAAGYLVETASHPHQALALVEARPHDVIFLDIGLPDMDGYQLASEIRARVPAGRTRLLALSGYGREEDRRRTAEAGFDGHLVKPVSLADILAAMSAP